MKIESVLISSGHFDWYKEWDKIINNVEEVRKSLEKNIVLNHSNFCLFKSGFGQCHPMSIYHLICTVLFIRYVLIIYPM